MKLPQATIFIISDGTGETASTMIRAALVQYSSHEVNVVRMKNVRTEEHVVNLIEDVFERKGMIVHTFASEEMRALIFEKASEKGIHVVDLMGPLLNSLGDYLGEDHSAGEAGLLRSVDERYFKRIEAIEFTVRHDDGKLLDQIGRASCRERV